MAPARVSDLREACVAEAFRIVEEAGAGGLSLREVARRLGVSHQAPYKHFRSRDHILAEIVARSFAEFAAFLTEGPEPEGEAPGDALRAMGACYMDYARRHPLKYRLMFNTPLPEPGKHPEMMQNAQRAFALLRERLKEMDLRPLRDGARPGAVHEALFVWSTLHGLASILQSEALHTLGLSQAEIEQAVGVCMARVSLALEP